MTTVSCQEGLVAQMAAMAQQTINPVAPYPIFFTSSSCGGGGSVASGAAFPLYYFPVDCTMSTLPDPTDNCLRIIDDPDFDPLTGGQLDASYVNVLPVLNPDYTTYAASNVFSDPTARIYSWFIPPYHRIVFYGANPATVVGGRDAAVAAGYWDSGNNGSTQEDACLGGLTLSRQGTNSTNYFFKYYSFRDPPTFAPRFYPGLPPCIDYFCNCGKQGTIPNCNPPSGFPTAWPCPGVEYSVPYFVIVRTKEFAQIVKEMCTANLSYSLGTTALGYPNGAWLNGQAACDQVVSAICNQADVTTGDDAELCTCFTEQVSLNQQYGDDLAVPVCCFGSNCQYNTNAYKTGDMLRNCCQFAECSQLVNQNPTMQAKASPAGSIECQGSFVRFPVPATPSPSVMPSTITTTKSTAPLYVWLIFGAAVVMVLLFIFLLSFLK